MASTSARRLAVLGTLAALVALVPSASAHWVKADGCGNPSPAWVDSNPLDNDLLGPDPDAVVVLHACMPCGDDGSSNIEVGPLKIFGCGDV